MMNLLLSYVLLLCSLQFVQSFMALSPSKTAVQSLESVVQQKRLSSALKSQPKDSTSTAKPRESWSCTIDIQQKDKIKDYLLKKLANGQHYEKDGMKYSLNSPREWMESIEAETGEGGAYTVLRADVQNENNQKTCIYNQEFHLERLERSYRKLLVSQHIQDDLNDDHIQTAIQDSKNMIQALMQKAVEDLKFEHSHGAGHVIVLMITILWSKDEGNAIKVQSHAFSTNTPSLPHEYNPKPITASIAIPGNDEEVLPSRHDNYPEAKLSLWCRVRRPLELKFKTENIGEVLLTRIDSSGDVELLEGLTSNIFVVYKDGSIRTCSTLDALDGCARNFVITAAKEIGLKISHEPITINDAKNGLWAEVFVTSAIRLVIPVGSIMIPVYDDDGNISMENLWVEEPIENLEWKSSGRRWQTIYYRIIESNKHSN